MKFSNTNFTVSFITAYAFINCLGVILSHNLVNFELKYETETSITRNVFNGANIKCSSDFSVAEIYYAINDPDNFKTVKKFCETEFSLHANITLYENGIVFSFNNKVFKEFNETKINDTYSTHINLADLSPNSDSNVTFVINENKESNHDIIRTCLTNIQNGAKVEIQTPTNTTTSNTANNTLPEANPPVAAAVQNNENTTTEVHNSTTSSTLELPTSTQNQPRNDTQATPIASQTQPESQAQSNNQTTTQSQTTTAAQPESPASTTTQSAAITTNSTHTTRIEIEGDNKDKRMSSFLETN